MKILVIDQNNSVQQKWVEPLRGEGWGVVRARSTSDAEKILEFHGDSLNAIVVSEEFAAWSEKWNYPYIVLTNTWKEIQVMKHQNSAEHAAIAYLNNDSTLEQLKQAISQFQNHAPPLQTGTNATVEINLQSNVADDRTKVVSIESFSNAGVAASAASPSSEDQDRTRMMESTQLEDLPISQEIKDFINEKPEFDETAIEEEIPSMQIELSAPVESTIEEIPEVQLMDDQVSEMETAPVMNYGNRSTDHKDLETMKNYLALREQDVAVLTGQMRSAQERVQQLEMQLKVERARSAELNHLVQKQDQQIQNFNRDKEVEFEVLYQQVEDLNLQLRERTDKVRTIEAKLKITTDEVEKVKERVRVDIRRIRVREKDLESQLEILKKDSTALLMARDEKILELKRKIDLLEFNMELVQEQYGKERNSSEQLRHKLKEAASAMKRAGGLLDHEN